VVGRLAQHLMRAPSHCNDLAAAPVDSDNGRFIKDDSASFQIEAKVGCSQINAHIHIREQPAHHSIFKEFHRSLSYPADVSA